eukprot:COSAG01_NODE_19164_length_1026_cov_4.189860_1_plen_74_part_10
MRDYEVEEGALDATLGVISFTQRYRDGCVTRWLARLVDVGAEQEQEEEHGGGGGRRPVGVFEMHGDWRGACNGQ